MDSVLRSPFSIFLLLVLIWLSASLVFADVTAHLHMSISPGGDEAAAVRSGTARVYAVLDYQDAAQTEFQVLVYAGGGAVLFEQSDVYDGSGQQSIEITGRDILAGYVSAAQEESADLEEAEQIALQASSASAKRVRTATVVNVVGVLDSVLADLERYPLSLDILDQLGTARDLAAQVEAQGTQIMTEVSDDDLDAEMDKLRTLVTDTVGALDSGLPDIDTNVERAWLDGTYTIQLKRDGQISVGFDWDVNPDGVPGTPVAPSPSAEAEPTRTTTPTETREPTLTPTGRPAATATPRPTSVSGVRATPTLQPTLSQSRTVPTVTVVPTDQDAGQTGPIILPPTATFAAVQPRPRASATSPLVAGGQTGYPAPPTAEVVTPVETPAVQVMAEGETLPETEPTSQPADALAPVVSHETPLAPQEVSKGLPVVSIGAVIGAVMLGLVALWLRARV